MSLANGDILPRSSPAKTYTLTYHDFCRISNARLVWGVTYEPCSERAISLAWIISVILVRFISDCLNMSGGGSEFENGVEVAMMVK